MSSDTALSLEQMLFRALEASRKNAALMLWLDDPDSGPVLLDGDFDLDLAARKFMDLLAESSHAGSRID